MTKRKNNDTDSDAQKAGKKRKLVVSDKSNLTKEEYMALKTNRTQLPIFPLRKEIKATVLQHDTVIIMGETASGKTTQIPQYLFKVGLDKKGIIGITQPRRVAAITVAAQVAKEMNTSLGATVGYHVRFKNVTTAKTKIKFLTDGMLVREALSDPHFSTYSVVILDEAHERSINTDLLLALVKSAQTARRDSPNPLKVVIMSATLNTEKFSSYFPGSKVLNIPGRQHPIEDRWIAKNTREDYVYTSLLLTAEIHTKEAPGDILVFLTGAEEILKAVKMIEDLSNKLPNLVPLPLFGNLAQKEQMKVFQPVAAGQRKVIFSTNIAETSLTIPGIKYVVDCGRGKEKYHITNSVQDVLEVKKISKQQVLQRRGRAGRESSGICYHCYTKKDYLELKEESVPEIQRVNLRSTMLEMLAMGINSPATFDFLDPPPRELIRTSLQDLIGLGAAQDCGEDIYRITELGKKMAQFPLDPRFSKILIMAENLGCTVEVVAILAMLSVPNIYYIPPGQTKRNHDYFMEFVSFFGDHLTLLKIYRAFVKNKKNDDWCYRNQLDFHNLKNAHDIRKQLVAILQTNSISLLSCNDNLDQVRKCFLYGLFHNVAQREKDDTYVTLENKQKVFVHPSSVMLKKCSEYVLYTDLVKTTQDYMKNVSAVDSRWLKEVESDYFKQKIDSLHPKKS